jgi:putative two-component system response regulator
MPTASAPRVLIVDAVPLIRWHHERLDGRGYPDGLTGDDIPPMVRVLSIADVYDSLASDRPYRAPIPHELCLDMLRDNARGGGLDPDLVTLFSEIVTPCPRSPLSPCHLPAPRPWR